MRILILADKLSPTDDLQTALVSVHVVEVHAVPQDVCSALVRDPDAIGIMRVSSSAMAAFCCREWRAAGVTNILLVLLDVDAAHHTAMSFVLRCGADDIQPAPIDTDELLARLHALSRRGKKYNDHLLIKMPRCVFDAETGNCEGNGKKAHLTGVEAKILMALATDPEATFSKLQLMDWIYGGADDEPMPKIIDVLVCKLRRKLVEMNDGLDVVETVWGRGYRFVPKGFPPSFSEGRKRGASRA